MSETKTFVVTSIETITRRVTFTVDVTSDDQDADWKAMATEKWHEGEREYLDDDELETIDNEIESVRLLLENGQTEK